MVAAISPPGEWSQNMALKCRVALPGSSPEHIYHAIAPPVQGASLEESIEQALDSSVGGIEDRITTPMHDLIQERAKIPKESEDHVPGPGSSAPVETSEAAATPDQVDNSGISSTGSARRNRDKSSSQKALRSDSPRFQGDSSSLILSQEKFRMYADAIGFTPALQSDHSQLNLSITIRSDQAV